MGKYPVSRYYKSVKLLQAELTEMSNNGDAA